MSFEALALHLTKFAILTNTSRAILSPPYPLNSRGKTFSRNSSSIHSRPFSHPAPYFLVKYVVLLAKYLPGSVQFLSVAWLYPLSLEEVTLKLCVDPLST